eukprot:Phypoly_transcript_07703.p1 GENE.Phypoly_transcript_07703~~Phypoly_transcript_07703.p1  ORF type:complete len:369 (+),score=52.75 Phypoly_transcript_07703:408-1514(+)
MDESEFFDVEGEAVVWTKNEAEAEDDELNPWEGRKDVVLHVDEGLETFPSSLSDPSFFRTRTLYLFNNLLTEIPSSISLLSNLREMDLSHNRISTLHENLTLLPHLETINLTDNKLPSFPLLLTRIPSLQTLQIGSNNLTYIPSEVSNLTNLISLELRYNQIGQLPDSIRTMSNLTNLNLFNNALTAFPDLVLQMPGLLNLELRNNPIPSVPKNIVSYLPTTRVAASVPHRVLDGFFIGDYATATNLASLKNSKITHILTVMNSLEPPPFPLEFVYKKFHVRDDEDEDLVAIFSQCHEFIETGRKESGVLVHCAAGISRSATVVLSYLMKTRKSNFDCELEYLRSVRPIVDPNPGFVKQLKLYEKQWE